MYEEEDVFIKGEKMVCLKEFKKFKIIFYLKKNNILDFFFKIL